MDDLDFTPSQKDGEHKSYPPFDTDSSSSPSVSSRDDDDSDVAWARGVDLRAKVHELERVEEALDALAHL